MVLAIIIHPLEGNFFADRLNKEIVYTYYMYLMELYLLGITIRNGTFYTNILAKK